MTLHKLPRLLSDKDIYAFLFILSLISFSLVAVFHGEAQKHFLYLRYGGLTGVNRELGYILEIIALVLFGFGTLSVFLIAFTKVSEQP